MSGRSRARLAWSLLGLYVLLSLTVLVFAWLSRDSPGRQEDWGTTYGSLVWLAIFAGFPSVGAVIASRRVGAIGWICLSVGLVIAVTAVSTRYGVYALVTEPGSLPGGAFAVYVENWSWVVALGLIGVFLVLLFPDGRLPSRRWRWVAIAAAGGMAAIILAIGLAPGVAEGKVAVENPLGIEAAEGVLEVLLVVGLAVFFPSLVAALVGAVVRFRRAGREQRQQLKWFASAATVTAVLYVSSVPAGFVSETLQMVLVDVGVVAWASLPIAVGVAILRYRLYDIDLVINKALVLGALAAFITAVYVTIVVGVSALLGTAGDPNIVLSIVGTAVVAVAFQPARERAQRLANRLVYGYRASPYEVLAAFSAEAAGAVATEDVLPTVARTVAEGTGAVRSDVWVKSGGDLRLAASWPEASGNSSRRVALHDGRLPAMPGVERAVPVRHQDELLGALAVSMPRGESLAPAQEKLLVDLAAQAGLVLRNVGLTAELLARLEDLHASRQRLVSAQDEERRRLERNLHDGAQQHLVALKVKLNLASRQAGEEWLKDALVSLQSDADEAIEALRDLARGIYPPLLAEQGLSSALEAHARKSPLGVAIAAEGVARYAQDMEAAIYFCCLEALQNVAKYSGATEALIRLAEDEGRLAFAVEDDGAGFDPASTARGSGLQNMADRIEALGGTLAVSSTPGVGTTVSGAVPLTPSRA